MKAHTFYVQEQRAGHAYAGTALAQESVHSSRGADPGFIVHWTFPPSLTKESTWLAYYVNLSLPRSFSKLLSHGLPNREIFEGGPPEGILSRFSDMFKETEEATRVRAAEVMRNLGWDTTD
mgnify:CR=1 FL=1